MNLVYHARAWAHGSYPMEAAVELLAHHGVWLHRPDFLRLAVDHEPPYAVIDFEAAHVALASGRLPCSGSEAAVLRIALSLGHGLPVDLGPAITRLDTTNLGYVLAAIAHASGNRAAWHTTERDRP
ncbi:hypothetical protein ACFXJ8_25800 [Nonomuraea sp. NPDC059194]|uniref:hypothetical protein n=1 Tax=Nonomuraea sp. NPDC059194 TaxID=3346764 RepID=UPI00367D78D6